MRFLLLEHGAVFKMTILPKYSNNENEVSDICSYCVSKFHAVTIAPRKAAVGKERCPKFPLPAEN